MKIIKIIQIIELCTIVNDTEKFYTANSIQCETNSLVNKIFKNVTTRFG